MCDVWVDDWRYEVGGGDLSIFSFKDSQGLKTLLERISYVLELAPIVPNTRHFFVLID